MATGEHWGYQRCGRYAYQRVLMHSTNPDHLAPSTSSLMDIPPLPVAPRYRRDGGSVLNRSPR
jgi:hypothetical protein